MARWESLFSKAITKVEQIKSGRKRNFGAFPSPDGPSSDPFEGVLVKMVVVVEPSPKVIDTLVAGRDRVPNALHRASRVPPHTGIESPRRFEGRHVD